MTLLGNFVRTREQGEQRMYWRSMNGMRSSSRTHSFLMKTLILASHAPSAPFVPFERILFFLSGHLYKISQQSHKSAPTGILPILIVKNHYRSVEGVDNLQQPIMIFKNRYRQCHPERSEG